VTVSIRIGALAACNTAARYSIVIVLLPFA